MKVRDLIKMPIDIDMYDDVCEELAIAFCGPLVLTEEGEKQFAEVLEYEVTLHNNGSCHVGIVEIDDEEDDVWEARLKKAKKFFYGAAGYCTVDEYEKWFKED